jgi:hypothetical protein
MKCTKCGGPTLVTQVRADSGRRRRDCRWCHHVFHTQEVEVEAFEHGGARRGDSYRKQAAGLGPNGPSILNETKIP